MIRSEDIAYSDKRIVVLHPQCKKGILICTHVPKNRIYLSCNIPYYVRDIDYSTTKNEIISSYGYLWLIQKKKIYIRVDPYKTYIDDTLMTLEEYMNTRRNMSIFKQCIYNVNNKYRIGFHAFKLSFFDIVKVDDDINI